MTLIDHLSNQMFNSTIDQIIIKPIESRCLVITVFIMIYVAFP